MSRQYLGLAVGGPADGHRIVADSTVLLVQQRPQVLLGGSSPATWPTNLPTFQYNWKDCGQIALWVPEGWDEGQLRKHMADAIGWTGLATIYEQVRIMQAEETGQQT